MRHSDAVAALESALEGKDDLYLSGVKEVRKFNVSSKWSGSEGLDLGEYMLVEAIIAVRQV